MMAIYGRRVIGHMIITGVITGYPVFGLGRHNTDIYGRPVTGAMKAVYMAFIVAIGALTWAFTVA